MPLKHIHLVKHAFVIPCSESLVLFNELNVVFCGLNVYVLAFIFELLLSHQLFLSNDVDVVLERHVVQALQHIFMGDVLFREKCEYVLEVVEAESIVRRNLKRCDETIHCLDISV